MSDTNSLNLTDEFDARVWTQEWLRIIKENPSIPADEGAMLGWFANAIMSGYDHAKRESEIDKQALIKALQDIKNELGVPGDEYPAPVANAYVIADAVIHRVFANPTPSASDGDAADTEGE